MPRKRRRTHPLEDPGFNRQVERLLEEQRATALPTDAELAASAEVTESDVDRAVELAREANRGSPYERLLG